MSYPFTLYNEKYKINKGSFMGEERILDKVIKYLDTHKEEQEKWLSGKREPLRILRLIEKEDGITK